MLSVAWISCPQNWTLSSVQAGLQVVIAVLCTVGIFVFSRFCWQLSSLRVATHRHVALPLLISIRTIGEAFDTLLLLKSKIFQRKHWRLLAQTIVVILLSVAIIVSGPIAKASTRVGSIIRLTTEKGLLANRGFNSVGYGLVAWNQTTDSLNKAGFPYDQLLDYLPPANVDWIYKPAEWNSTWKMECNRTEPTPITLVDTGNCTGVYHEIPGIEKVFPYDNFYSIQPSYYGVYNGTKISDGYLFLNGWTIEKMFGDIISQLTFSVAAIKVHNAVKPENSTTGCILGEGPIEESSYTMAQCFIRRDESVPADMISIAYPDHNDLGMVADAYIANWVPYLAQESASGGQVRNPSPDELIRFYQTYQAVKDTFRRHPVNRDLSEKLAVVQISSTYLAFGILLALLNLVGLLNILWFMFRHAHIIAATPESKIDWAVQSITRGEGQSVGKVSGGRYSVIATSIDPEKASRHHLRHHFENAKFGTRHDEADSVPLTANPRSAEPLRRVTSEPLPQEQFSQYMQYTPQPQRPQQSQHMMYSIDPHEAQFAAQDTSYNNIYAAPVYQNSQYEHYQPRGHNGYQSLNDRNMI